MPGAHTAGAVCACFAGIDPSPRVCRAARTASTTAAYSPVFLALKQRIRHTDILASRFSSVSLCSGAESPRLKLGEARPRVHWIRFRARRGVLAAPSARRAILF